MSSEIEITNTLAFLFPEDATQPTVADMAGFVKALKGDLSLMETAYKITDEKSVFIRFKTDEAMKFVLENNSQSLPFHYTNGNKVAVRMMVAGNMRYVRVFDLPPEVSDADLVTVMKEYGKIKRTVRERFPADFQLDLFTGVRGLYVNIEKEIPDILYFRNRKGRVYYDGIKPKCFCCKSELHFKKDCPVLRERTSVKQQKQATVVAEIETSEEQSVENASIVVEGIEDKNGKTSEKRQQKTKKTETKRQRSLDTDSQSDSAQSQAHKRQNKSNTSSSEGEDGSLIAAVDASPRKIRQRIASYDWITDENERQSLIEEDKQRIAKATNTPMDHFVFYHDWFSFNFCNIFFM